jgi:hypothetical protein
MKKTLIAIVLMYSIPAYPVDMWIDVDTAVTVLANKVPIIIDTSPYDVNEAVALTDAGFDLAWVFQTPAGAITYTTVTPTGGAGVYDWSHVGNGVYKIEIPASGGGTINNDTEGFGYFVLLTTDNREAVGPVYGFRKASMNNVMIENGTLQDNLEDDYDGTGYAGGSIEKKADVTSADGNDLVIDNFVDFFGNVGPGDPYEKFEDKFDGTTISLADNYNDAGTIPDMNDAIKTLLPADFNTVSVTAGNLHAHVKAGDNNVVMDVNQTDVQTAIEGSATDTAVDAIQAKTDGLNFTGNYVQSHLMGANDNVVVDANVASFDTGAITAAAFAADSLTASALNSDAVAEIWAQVLSDVTGVPVATDTVLVMLAHVNQRLFAESTQTTAELQQKDFGGTKRYEQTTTKVLATSLTIGAARAND